MHAFLLPLTFSHLYHAYFLTGYFKGLSGKTSYVKGRIHSLDTLKGIALFFVVYIHARSFLSTWTVMENFNFLLANLSRFAVPAFFMTSGFLLALKLGEDSGRSEDLESTTLWHRQSIFLL